jgi:enoyl-CoA hydratase
MGTCEMTGQLDVIREGNLGIIALNRPEAINALSLEMIEGITRTLEQWRDDDEIRAVLFEGRGARGFCSGGDVRAVRELVLAGQLDAADAYFAAEYAMNALISTYPKPTVAVTHGVVMGGGIGIAGHCRYRFTTPDARFAMPEAAIGFVSDVGVSYLLAKAPLHRAVLFLMTGIAVGPADALALGLTDCVHDPARREALLRAVALAAEAANPDAELVHLVQAEMVPEGEAPFTLTADAYRKAQWTQAIDVLRAVTDEKLVAALRAGSPTSAVAIFESHMAARQMAGINDVLAIDLKMASLMCRRADFVEGVRAVLVDKDRNPAWNKGDVVAVSKAIDEITQALRPV